MSRITSNVSPDTSHLSAVPFHRRQQPQTWTLPIIILHYAQKYISWGTRHLTQKQKKICLALQF